MTKLGRLEKVELITLLSPQWIAKMYAGKVGRDHLGLGSVSSDQILPYLSPSINVLTFHPRYHSFYVFLLDEFWKTDRLRSRAQWVAFYRPREFIFSVGAYLCQQPEHGEMGNIVGGQKTGPLANQQLNQYNTAYDYIDSELGGYGLYYRTVMAELGLIYPGGRGLPTPIDVPTELGREIAESFREAVQVTEYYQEYFSNDVTDVPIDVIREYIHKACLCQAQVIDAPDRKYLNRIFLHGGGERNASMRQETFRLFLDIADQTGSFPLNEDSFRQLLYFQATQSGITYHPRDQVLDIYKKWRLYQAREYYAFALNSLWYHFCDWGVNRGGEIHPLPIAEFWEYVEQNLDFDTLFGNLNLPPSLLRAESGFRNLLDFLKDIFNADGNNFDNKCDVNSAIHEHILYNLALDHKSIPYIMVAGMITLLALVYLRFGREELWKKPEWSISKMGENGRLSIDEFIRTLRAKLNSGPVTIGEITKWLYNNYIILQHQIVATNKLPDNTFRFEREGQFFRFHALNNTLSFMNSRFDSISTTIHELGFCGELHLPDHELTPTGLEILLGDEM